MSRKRRDAKKRDSRVPVPQAPPSAPRRWLVPIAVAVLTVIAFIPALGAEFVAWDDSANFLQNPHYRGLGLTQLEWMWTTTLLGHYVPVTWMTLGLDYVLWGMNPAGYHAVNLVLHAANAVLLYFIARRLLRLAASDTLDARTLDVASAFAALVFAIHPLRAESVAWITERRDMVSLFFSFATVLYYLRATSDPARFARWYVVSLATFVCALLSKGTAVTLPAALLVMNVYPLRRLGSPSTWSQPSTRRAIAELVPYGVLSLAFGILSIIVLEPKGQLPAYGKVVVSAYSFAFYLWKTVAPVGLAPLYETPPRVNPAAPWFIVSYFVTIVVIAAAWLVRRRWPAVTAAVVAFTLLVFPFLGIIQNGPHIAADRYTYHAAPALALLAAGVVTLPVRRAVLAAIGAVVVVALGGLTWRQTHVWQNSETVWRRVLELDSASYLANNNLGVVLAEQGKSAEAIEHYSRSLRTRPAYADAHNNLGFELAERGDIDGAITHYAKAIEIQPEYADAEVNWGNALLVQRRFDEAIAHYAKAAAIDPDRARVYFNWGVALREKDDLAGAAERFKRALSLDPGFDDARRLLAEALTALSAQRPAASPR